MSASHATVRHGRTATRHNGDHLAVGRLGEELATAHLRRDGMRVVDRNWRCAVGELDIVARHGVELVVCEVKTRRSTRFGTPMTAIDVDKAGRLQRLARLWQRAGGERGRLRFDAVCIVLHGDGTATLDHRRGVL